MHMRRVLAVGLAAAGMTAAAVLVPATANAATTSGSCDPVHIANSAGRFDGWSCKDDDGTAVGGQLRDTNPGGGCVVLAVTFVNDGLKTTRPACYGQRFPIWVGQASSYDVISIDVIPQ
jgi:hypothetical protein